MRHAPTFVQLALAALQIVAQLRRAALQIFGIATACNVQIPVAETEVIIDPIAGFG